MNIFEILNEKYYLPKKVKLFQAFAGIGCQALAFDKIGIEYINVGISEIDKYALKSYEAIHGNLNNFGSICDIKGYDLPQIDVFTYSFPCTDLSKAGKQKGLGNTRSGLVYEVLRILKEAKESNNLPKVLIMENVVDLVQVKFIRQFQEIQKELEDLGYTNYTETLNAKDYGVAQNRDRVFMVSILGDYYYEFPKPIKLEKRLKDYLEDEVDEKYYLSDKFIKGMLKEDTGGVDRKGQFMRSFQETIEERIASTITTRETNVATSNFILMPEKTNRGCVEAYDGDGVYINRPHQKRGVVQKGMIQTIKANNSDLGVVVPNETYVHERLEEFKNENGYYPEFFNPYNKKELEDTSPTITTLCGSWQSSSTTTILEKQNKDLIVRKLTPLECWRLMGIDDEDFYKASQVCSNAQLYKQAGNGIVVDVFASILSTMKGNV